MCGASRVTRLLLPSILLFAIAHFAIAPAPAFAATEPAPFCGPDEVPHFAYGIATLHDAIGSIMGEPLECEHPISAIGDTLQQTTTGLAIYRQSANTPEFTDGWNHWALGQDGVSAWSGDDSAASPVTASPNGCVDVGESLCLNATPDVAPTVALLSESNAATPLLRAAARAGYLIRSGDLPLDVLGLFRPSRHDVILSTSLDHYPQVDRGPVLAHELQHVSDWLAQGTALESPNGCLVTETNAFHTESVVWLELEGGQLPMPTNDLELEFNMISHAIVADPEGFASRLTIVYHNQCDSSISEIVTSP